MGWRDVERSRGWRRVGGIGRGRISGGVGRIEGGGVRRCRRRIERVRDGSGGGRRWRE